jgi:hypothetical protein
MPKSSIVGSAQKDLSNRKCSSRRVRENNLLSAFLGPFSAIGARFGNARLKRLCIDYPIHKVEGAVGGSLYTERAFSARARRWRHALCAADQRAIPLAVGTLPPRLPSQRLYSRLLILDRLTEPKTISRRSQRQNETRLANLFEKWRERNSRGLSNVLHLLPAGVKHVTLSIALCTVIIVIAVFAFTLWIDHHRRE